MKKLVLAAMAAAFVSAPAIASTFMDSGYDMNKPYIDDQAWFNVDIDNGDVTGNGQFYVVAGETYELGLGKDGSLFINGENVGITFDKSYNAGKAKAALEIKSEADLMAWIKEQTGMKPSKLVAAYAAQTHTINGMQMAAETAAEANDALEADIKALEADIKTLCDMIDATSVEVGGEICK